MKNASLTLVISLIITGCGACSNTTTGSGSDGACVGQFSIMAMGPAEGDVALSTANAIFLNVKATVSCGTATVNMLSLYIESETPTSFCVSPCSSDQSLWNFRHPRLTSGTTEKGSTSFHLATEYNGTPIIEAVFNQPLLIGEGKDNSFELRIDVAPSEVVSGSLLGRRFRGVLGKVGFASPVSVVLDPMLPIRGGYQTIISP